MSEPKRLTQAELAAIEARRKNTTGESWNAVGNTVLFAPGVWVAFPGAFGNTEFVARSREDMDALLSHIAALSAELAALRAIIAELTAGEWAGFTGSRCQYCHCTFDSNHAPTCPIVRGRALLKGTGDADER